MSGSLSELCKEGGVVPVGIGAGGGVGWAGDWSVVWAGGGGRQRARKLAEEVRAG